MLLSAESSGSSWAWSQLSFIKQHTAGSAALPMRNKRACVWGAKTLWGYCSEVVSSSVFAEDKILFSSQPYFLRIICWKHSNSPNSYSFPNQPPDPGTKQWHPSGLSLELSTQHWVLLYSADSNENNFELARAKTLQWYNTAHVSICYCLGYCQRAAQALELELPYPLFWP